MQTAFPMTSATRFGPSSHAACTGKAPVSVIVPVKNEAENLLRCLPALAWADEVFVVDSQSTDQTEEVAAAFGRSVVQFHFNGTYPKKKNWALDHLPFRNEWVLIVDADEVVVPELADEISRRITRNEADGLLPELSLLLPRPPDSPLRVCLVLEPAAVQASPGPLREDARSHRRAHRRQRGPRARRARRPGPPPQERARASRLSRRSRPGSRSTTVTRSGRPRRASGSSSSRSRNRSEACSDSNAGSRRSPGDCPCARSFGSFTPTSCVSGSSMDDRASSSAVSWPSTTFWRRPTDTNSTLTMEGSAVNTIVLDKMLRVVSRKTGAWVGGSLYSLEKTLEAMALRPFELHLEFTNLCNANCIFCPYQFQERPTGFMSDQVFEKAVNDYVKINGGSVGLTPIVGDALIDPKFLTRVRHLRSLPQIDRIFLTTNAILLDKHGISEVLTSGLTSVMISTSGFEKESYKRIYRSPAYDRMKENVTHLVEENARLGSPVHISICLRTDRPLADVMRDPDFGRFSRITPRSILPGATDPSAEESRVKRFRDKCSSGKLLPRRRPVEASITAPWS